MREPKARMNLLDLSVHWVEKIIDAGVPKDTYQPFFKQLFTDMGRLDSQASKRRLLSSECTRFMKGYKSG